MDFGLGVGPGLFNFQLAKMFILVVEVQFSLLYSLDLLFLESVALCEQHRMGRMAGRVELHLESVKEQPLTREDILFYYLSIKV